MKPLNKWTAAFYLAVIFFAGSITGKVMSIKSSKEILYRPPRVEDMNRQRMARLKSTLNLTPDQVKTIEPIVQETSAKLSKVYNECMGLVYKTIENENRRLFPLLTPEQRERLEQMASERDDFLKQKCKFRQHEVPRDQSNELTSEK